MRHHTFVIGTGVDFASVDEAFARLLHTSARWLDDDGAQRARLGLHELLVNIRDHAYHGGPGPIDVGMTVTPRGCTVTVTDWGHGFRGADMPALPVLSEWGGYGLAIIEGSFDEVAYQRGIGRNRWTLTVRAKEAVA